MLPYATEYGLFMPACALLWPRGAGSTPCSCVVIILIATMPDSSDHTENVYPKAGFFHGARICAQRSCFPWEYCSCSCDGKPVMAQPGPDTSKVRTVLHGTFFTQPIDVRACFIQRRTSIGGNGQK